MIVFKTLHGIWRLNKHIRIEYISLCHRKSHLYAIFFSTPAEYI